MICSTYQDLPYKQIGLFFSDGKVSADGAVKDGVVIVDISDHYAHSSSGRLKKREKKLSLKFAEGST